MKGWIILFTAIILSFILEALIYDYSEILASIIQLLTISTPLLYYTRQNYNTLIHKPDTDEIILAVALFIAYIFYALIMITILDALGLTGTGGVLSEDYVTIQTIISLIFTMMTEELIKFIPLMFFMKIFYKYSENKKYSFIFSTIIVLVGFGLLHYNTSVTLYSVLLIQGLGSIFEIIGYYKTKNLLVPYLSHLLTDAYLMSLILLGI